MPGRRLTRRDGRALLVAEAPPRGARPPHRALDGPAGDRLAGYLGWDRAELLHRFDTVNLLGRWPGAQGKGAAWPMDRARRAAARLPLSGAVVLLGERVARAYALSDLCWGRWLALPSGGWATVIPHPSGVNRLYNDQQFRDLAKEVLLDAAYASKFEGLPVRRTLRSGDSGAIVTAVPDPPR